MHISHNKVDAQEKTLNYSVKYRKLKAAALLVKKGASVAVSCQAVFLSHPMR